jgi:glycosyltransferase involved in cell wall biosynthesis
MGYWVIEPAPASLDVSIVVPVKDEAENVAALAAEIRAAMEATRHSWECVWVDDGSTDDTAAALLRIASEDARHRVLRLDGNHGQSAAIASGFADARGEILVTLDGDGQNDPGDVPRVVALLLAQGADVVNGRRARRQDGWVRRLSSRTANGFRNWITDERVSDVGCSLRAVRRQAVRHLFVFRGMHRFLPTLARLNGASRILEIPVGHRPRLRGQTKYGIGNRLWVGLADAFAVRWLQWRGVSAPPRLAPTLPARDGPAAKVAQEVEP